MCVKSLTLSPVMYAYENNEAICAFQGHFLEEMLIVRIFRELCAVYRLCLYNDAYKKRYMTPLYVLCFSWKERIARPNFLERVFT